MVFGGGKVGLMGVTADGVLDHDGKAIGVIPSFLKVRELAHEGLTEMITVESLQERKLTMYRNADGFLSLPGGLGTLEELFEILSWSQLGLHMKPIGILNCNGFYNALINQLEYMNKEGFLDPTALSLVMVSEDFKDLIQRMTRYQAPDVKKWIEQDQL